MPFYSLPSGGSPVLAGVTAPTGGVGNVGDLFIDKAAKVLYGPKEPGGWPTGPIDLSNGPTGATSTVTGPTGPSGGPTGATGPTGSWSQPQPINAQTASYTLVLSDAGKLVTMSSATGTLTVTVPPASSVAFATGTCVDIARIGVAAVSITGATGVTINSPLGQSINSQYSVASVLLYVNNTWILSGDTAQ